MNYIKKLQAENAELNLTAAAAQTELTDLFTYLQSSKFHNDPTVQVQDVMNRLAALRGLLTEMGA